MYNSNSTSGEHIYVVIFIVHEAVSFTRHYTEILLAVRLNIYYAIIITNTKVKFERFVNITSDSVLTGDSGRWERLRLTLYKMKKIKKQIPPFKKYMNRNFLHKLVFDPHYLRVTCYALLVVEFCLNILIIERIRYTEIDWIAYMQEVEGFLNGTLDYRYLKGEAVTLR